MTNEELYKPDLTPIEEIENKFEALKPRTQKEIIEYQINWYKTNIKIKQDEIKNMKDKIKFLKIGLKNEDINITK